MASWTNAITYNNVATKLAEIVEDTPTWKLVAGGSLLLVGGYFVFYRDRNAPPGPRGYPILGIAPWLDKDLSHLNLLDITKKYGDVCKVSIMKSEIILVSGEKNIYDVYINKQDDFANRISSIRFEAVLNGIKDIPSMDDDEVFRETKKMTLRSLKTYSEGMKRVEEISSEIIGDFLDYLESTEGRPVDISNKLKVLFGTIIASMTLEKKIPDSVMEKFVASYDEIFSLLLSPNTAILELFPWLRFFGNKAYNTLRRIANERDDIFIPIYKEAVANFDSNDIKTSTEQILHYMNQSSLNYEFKHLYGISIGLIIAGFATTSATLYGLFPILMAHRHIEQRILQEIEDNIGFSRFPSLEDRPNMPYTEATMLEAHRFLSIAPFSLPHIAVRNSALGGYNIKKGSMIWPNIYGLHHDEEIWGDPENFRPERFLDKNGQVLSIDHRYRKCLLPFGAGRRLCVGKNLANNRLFLFLTSTIQKFHFNPENGKTVGWDAKHMINGLILSHKPYKMCFTPKNN